MIEKVSKLAAVVKVLDDMRSEGIIGDYAVGGAVAAALHSQPITTIDLDIFFVFDPPQSGLILSLEPIYNYFREHGYEFDKDFIFVAGWPVQFIESSHEALWLDAVKNARPMKVNDANVMVLPAEHLAAMWCETGRTKDLAKIEEFDQARSMTREMLRDVLERFGKMEQWRRIQGGLSNEYKF